MKAPQILQLLQAGDLSQAADQIDAIGRECIASPWDIGSLAGFADLCTMFQFYAIRQVADTLEPEAPPPSQEELAQAMAMAHQ